MSSTIDVDEVRHRLTSERVLDHYQFPTKRSGRDLISSTCPRRVDHSRRAFVISIETGQWQCFPCNISGDALRLVAEFEQISDRTDFPAVLAKAAEIAGVTASDLPEEERQHRRELWRAVRTAAEEADRRRRAELEVAAVSRATAYWAALDRRDAKGEEYLASRGVLDALRFDLVRFDRRHGGSPALALHARDGKIRNVVRRRLPELGEPKTPGLPSCPTPGTFAGAVWEIAIAKRDVVITEGVFDSIAASLAWGKAIVLGAHGANNLPSIARAAAPHVALVKTRLSIVPHEDRAGCQRAKEACHAAQAAGLSVLDGTLRIVRTGAADLADAWLQGWRPAA